MSKSNSDHLFMLIKSLGKGEKRHFKVNSNKHVLNGANIYVKLFDAIGAQNIYNENKLKQNKIFRNLASLKNHLYNVILKSLKEYHSGVGIEIKNILIQIEILFNKSLFPHCIKLINKAKAICKKYELFEAMLEVYKWEYRVAIKLYDISLSMDILREEKDLIKLINNLKIYRDIASDLSFQYQLYGAKRNYSGLQKINKLFSNPYLRNEKRALSIRALENYYSCYCFYGLYQGDFHQLYRYGKKMIYTYHQNSHLILFYPSNYINTLNNCLVATQKLKLYNEMYSYITLLREHRKNLVAAADKTTAFFFLYHVLNYYALTGLFKDGEKDTIQIEKELKEHFTALNDHQKSILFLNISKVYFGLGNYTKCLQLLNKILVLEGVKGRTDIECFIRLFYIIVHYEMRSDEDFLLSQFKSVYRYLYTSQRLYKFESIMMEFIKEIITKGIKKQNLRERLAAVRLKLIHLEKNKYEKHAFEHFDYISWLESKIQNRSFAEVVKEKNKGIS